jgi:hypothetical protein
LRIVDWETAGWFPLYWEYTTAKNINAYNPFWADLVDYLIVPEELKIETIKCKFFGSF